MGFEGDGCVVARSRPYGRKTLVSAELLIRSGEKMMLSFTTASHLGKGSFQFEDALRKLMGSKEERWRPAVGVCLLPGAICRAVRAGRPSLH